MLWYFDGISQRNVISNDIRYPDIILTAQYFDIYSYVLFWNYNALSWHFVDI